MSGIPHSKLVLEANIYSNIKPIVLIQSDKNTKRLPVLSATLIYDNTTINIDDFINSLKIESANYGYPSLQQVMEAWAYKSGIVFDRSKAWKINYLDTDVNEYTKCIFTDSWNFACFTKN